MQLIGRLRRRNHGVGSIIGAVFVALIFLSGFTFYAVAQGITQHYNDTMSSMSAVDWNRNQENVVIKQIAITSINHLNVTAENDGPIQSHLIWLGIFNTTAAPQNQTYEPLNEFVGQGVTDNIVSKSTVIAGNMYLIQLVTELGNTIESRFYPATYANCALTLISTPPTVYQGNNFTVLLTVTLNDTTLDVIQSLTASLSTTPSNLVQLMSNSPLSVNGLAQGNSAFFWWLYNATSVGTTVFNGTYNQAPLGVYALTTVNVLTGGIGPTGPQGPAGFSTNATFYDLIKNFPFGGAPTTLTPTALGASTCLVYPFEIDRNITVTAIYLRSGTSVVANCLLIGIYDSTGTRLYASGALTTVASGWIAITGISVTLASGTYYFGTTNNNVVNGGAAYAVTPGIGTATLPRWGSVATSSGAMPASITPSSITKTAGGWMCYVLLSSVTS